MNPTLGKTGIIQMMHYYIEIREKEYQTLLTHIPLCEYNNSKVSEATSKLN